MILPRFSLRWIFLATTVFAFVSLVFAQAARGREWAMAVTAMLIATVGLMMLQAAAFAVARLMRLVIAGGGAVAAPGQSPFAEQPPLKQVVEPPGDPQL